MRRGHLAASMMFALLAGCSIPDAPLPTGEEARASLEKALTTWKAGERVSTLTELKPPIDAVDHEWVARKVLTDYMIGTTVDGQGNKTFNVTLTLKGAQPKDVKYMVFGRDPVHIYRDEDFARMSNMEDGPTTTKGRR